MTAERRRDPRRRPERMFAAALAPERGRALPEPTARAWRPALGPLDDVRIHDSREADALARAVDARAVAFERSIAFAAGAYRPDTAQGQAVLGHELVHMAQPLALDGPVLAAPDHPAEREAASYGGGLVPREPRAPLHRIPRAEGLREGESLPVPLLMAIAGDRFLVRLDLTAARVLQFVIRAQGDLDVEGPGLTDRTITLPVMDVARPIVVDYLEIYPTDLAIDLYGDGSEVIRLVDEATPGATGDSRDHQWRVLRNGEIARRDSGRVESIVRVRLPSAPRNTVLGEAGTATPDRVVSALYSSYGAAFQISARRFGSTGLVAVHIQSAIYADLVGTHPTTLVRLDVAPERLTLAYTQRSGRTFAIDLNGDGVADITFDHTAADRTPAGAAGATNEVVRQHRFAATNRAGERIGEVNRHDQHHVTSLAAPLPAIPEDCRAPGTDEDAGAALGDNAPPLEDGRPAEASVYVIRSGGVLDLRVDGDGDRRTELLVRFRPEPASASDGRRLVHVEIFDLATWTRVSAELRLSELEVSRIAPLVTRPADSQNPAVIDVINQYLGPVASAPLQIEIDPPTTALIIPTIDDYERVYAIRVAGVPLELRAPSVALGPVSLRPPLATAPPLASALSTFRVADMWVTDVVLGEYGDRFQLTLRPGFLQDRLGLSAMDRDRPGETRALTLVDGAADQAPAVIERHPQQLVLALGPHELVLVDAIQAPMDEDVRVRRTHRVTVSGSAVPSTRTVRFDLVEGSFGYDDVGLEFRLGWGMRPPLPDEAERTYDDLWRSGHVLAGTLRGAIDRGMLTDPAYDTFRDAHRAMLALRVETALAPTEHRDALRAQTAGFLSAMREASPAAVSYDLALAGALVAAGSWDAAFSTYLAALRAYQRELREANDGDVGQRVMSTVASGVEVMRGLLAEGDSLAALRARIDGAAGAEVVSAHELGLISDEIFGPWDRLRRAMPLLRVVQADEATYAECSGDPGIQVAHDAALALHTAQCLASRDAPGHASYTGERYNASTRMYSGGHGPALANALDRRDWDGAFRSYEELMAATDRWVTHLLEVRRDEAPAGERAIWQQRLDNNRYLTHLRSQLAELAGLEGVLPVAATFVPDSSYVNAQGYVPAVPIRLFVWHDGAEWRLRDLTNPERPYLTSADGSASDGPPHALFAELNDNDRFPKGILYYQVGNGGVGGTVVCTAEKEWFEWAADIGLGLAAIGFVLATFGTGTVAVAGAYFLAGAAIANVAAASGRLADSLEHGHATTTSVILDILDIVASLASAGTLSSGLVVRSATQAARTGAAWTGAAARVAAFADKAYVPLTAVSMGADLTTVAVMTYDTLGQLDRLGSLPPEQAAQARQALLLQLALTGGLTALSVRGDLPELRAGRQNIILDVVGDVAVARAAGVHLGDAPINLPAGDARAHAAARWSLADDAVPPPTSLPADEAMAWRRAWLERPQPVVLRPDGGYEVALPPGAPRDVAEWLTRMAGPNSGVVRAARAFAVGDELAAVAASMPERRLDPFAPDWSTSTRGEVVGRLGGGPEAEAAVRRFEAARLGSTGTPGTFASERARVTRVIPDNELERIRELYRGYEVYVTGAPLGVARPGSDLGRIEIVVAVPAGVSPDMMAAIERRADLLGGIHPDPEFRSPGDTLAVDVRVVPTTHVIGLSATGMALHRIDDVRATLAVELDGLLAGHLRTMGLSADDLAYRLEVLPDEDFARQFASERGRAAFRIVDDLPVVYVRADATRVDLLKEAGHLADLADPAAAREVRILSGENFADWELQPAQFRFELYETKLTRELAANQRALDALRADPSATRGELAELEGERADLLRLREHMAAVTPDELAAMNAGVIPVPSYLSTPPWLFGKRTVYGAFDLAPPVFPADATRTTIARSGPTRSTAYNDSAVTEVRQVGWTWTERTQIYSAIDGEVTAVATVDGLTTVTVRRPTGGTQDYWFEGTLAPGVEVGARVSNGQTLGDEAAREYRLVDLEYGDGRITQRQEIARLGPDGGWIQRGSESTARGAIMEDAARRQVDTALTTALGRGEIAGFVHLPHQRGGGGFDDVIAVFHDGPDGLTATVRIREVKDYPNRSVPLEDFTAIRAEGGGLRANLDALRESVAEAIDARAAGLAVPAPFASMSDEQLAALSEALELDNHSIRIEIVIGPTTRIGREGHHAATVMADLRTELQSFMGYDALVTRVDGPERVSQAFAEEAARAVGRGP